MAKSKTKSRTPGTKITKRDTKAHTTIQNWLTLGQLRLEKCELLESRVAYTFALKEAKRLGDLSSTMKALSGLLRLASEAIDKEAVAKFDHELELLMAKYPTHVPPMAYYCKGVVASHQQKLMIAQSYFHRHLNAVSDDSKSSAESLARAWLMLAIVTWKRGLARRATFLSHAILTEYESQNLKGINGFVYLILGNIEEKARQLDEAMGWYQKAHTAFMAEHNWYYHLYVLYGYARIHRLQQNYVQAYWYLELVDKAASTAEFGLLKQEVAEERARLEQSAVDLLIDSRQGMIKTRESGQISLRKQYVLLHILEALSEAHGREGDDVDRGLSKAEIISKVWKENYRPEAHDNKLYYNINRLRKLIEPDLSKPQYLLNWKEGYRLAPGLRVQFIGKKNQSSA